ncbi:alkylated DNA repair dioxygenase AlkB [Pseudomonas nitritireducens]|uniref:Alkylated DNA repair dioxygenase AlkB n=1 Tax=Pseudomonas nitroreducens TaxID=46680 RepID=A0A7W7KE83_PSENT|nr:alpha-ketoglutarate-dependent dioxygenase AlkB [Pseudomonas nitritireducens]MBB4861227.1 alkylated DNA repair dioxygenase AlkB [Pseudomonas nitritireducens]
MEPIYVPGKVPDADAVFEHLWANLPWADRTDARREVFFSDKGLAYEYGSGAGVRLYEPELSWDSVVKGIQQDAEREFGVKFEACFINGYETQHHALGWHADDSPSIDATRPILVYSFGQAREIWTIPNDGNQGDKRAYLLESGSLFVMPAGMQQTHKHRIPKHDRPCKPRISLTFRGLV